MLSFSWNMIISVANLFALLILYKVLTRQIRLSWDIKCNLIRLIYSRNKDALLISVSLTVEGCKIEKEVKSGFIFSD